MHFCIMDPDRIIFVINVVADLRKVSHTWENFSEVAIYGK